MVTKMCLFHFSYNADILLYASCNAVEVSFYKFQTFVTKEYKRKVRSAPSCCTLMRGSVLVCVCAGLLCCLMCNFYWLLRGLAYGRELKSYRVVQSSQITGVNADASREQMHFLPDISQFCMGSFFPLFFSLPFANKIMHILHEGFCGCQLFLHDINSIQVGQFLLCF